MNENSILVKDSPVMMSRHRVVSWDGGRKLFGNEEESHTEDDFLHKLYENTVHGTCHMPGMCNGSIEDQLDVFMNCRQPLSMFSFFREHKTVDNVGVEVLPAGAYVLPTYCEYCKSPDTLHCPSHCDRPKLYFQKKRPPFQKLNANKWNPQNDFALTQEEEDDLDSSMDTASLASTSVSSESAGRSRGYQTDMESFDTSISPRQSSSWLGIWSGSAD